MKKLFLFLFLFIININLFAKKYVFEFKIVDKDKFENVTYSLSFVSFEKLPMDKDALKDSFLIVGSGNRELDIKNSHKSIIFNYYISDSKKNIIVKGSITSNKNDLKERPEINVIDINIFKEQQFNNVKSIEEFGSILKELVVKKSTAPLFDSTRFKSDFDYNLGTILFVDDVNKSYLKYELKTQELNINEKELNVTDFLQHNIIDVSTSSQSSVTANFKGVYAGLQLAFQNSRYVEYKLESFGNKKIQIVNPSEKIYSLLNTETPNEFIRNVFQAFNSSSKENKSKFKFLLVTGQFWLDSLKLMTKSYKEIKTEGTFDVNVFDFLKVSSDNKYAVNKSFVTNFNARRFNLDFEITDYTSAMYSAAYKYQGTVDIRNTSLVLDYYKALIKEKETTISQFIQSLSKVRNDVILLGDISSNIVSIEVIEPLPEIDTLSNIDKNKIKIGNKILGKISDEILLYKSYLNIIQPLKAVVAGIRLSNDEIERISSTYLITEDLRDKFNKSK